MFIIEPMFLAFGILGLTIILFIIDKIPVDIVALLALLALTLTNLIDPTQALAGFANSTVVTIAALFVVGGGLFRTGVANWLGNQLLRLAGDSNTRLLLVLMVGAAVLSAFLSNTGTVAVLIPAVVATAWRTGSIPSKLLIPLAFAAQIGGLLTLIGTPPNIVIVNAMKNNNLPFFGFFEFALIGIPLLIVGVGYLILFGQRFLPERHTGEARLGAASSPDELAEAYHLGSNLFRLRVRRVSSLVGKTLAEARLGQDFGLTVVRIERAQTDSTGEKMVQALDLLAEKTLRSSRSEKVTAALDTLAEKLGVEYPSTYEEDDVLTPSARTEIEADDILLVEGTIEALHNATMHYNLGLQKLDLPDDHPEETLLSQEVGLAEALITPRSALIGRTLPEIHFAEKYSVRVLGIWRRGKPIENKRLTSIRLIFGDALLVRGTWKAIGIMEQERRNFVIVGQPSGMVQPTTLTPRAYVALAALLGMLVMMLTGVVPTVIAVLITGLMMVLTGCLNMEQAYRAISWESVVLIAAMLPMSTALQETGGAEFIANGLVNGLGAYHPLLLMAGIFLLTTAFTQVISNTATTVLLVPIVLATASELGISPQPVMMMVAVGASTAFLTPIASPVNTLVLTPGGYHFGDFMKVGLPLLFLFLIVSIILVPLIWPL